MYSKDNILHILTILESIEKVFIYTEGFTDKDSFYTAGDQLRYNAVCHLLLAIGEESRKIEEKLKEEMSFISWEQIGGLRNRIAHDYRGIDPAIVFQIARYELMPLKDACLSMLQLIGADKLFLQQLVASDWYKHLGYLVKDTKGA